MDKAAHVGKLNDWKSENKTTYSGDIPDAIAQLRENEWTSVRFLPSSKLSFSTAHHHAKIAFYKVYSSDLKDHLKATTILSKGLKEEISSVKDDHVSLRSAIHLALAKTATTLQVE